MSNPNFCTRSDEKVAVKFRMQHTGHGFTIDMPWALVPQMGDEVQYGPVNISHTPRVIGRRFYIETCTVHITLG